MDQGELNFSDGTQAGFVAWRKVEEDRLFEQRLRAGLPLNRRVQLKLRDFDRPFEGWLMASTLPAKGSEARYQLANLAFDFGANEIESCTALDQPTSQASLSPPTHTISQ